MKGYDMEKKQEKQKEFTVKQKLSILGSFIKGEFMGAIYPNRDKDNKSIEIHTRGNVFHRLGGTITKEEHERILDKEFK
jgi:hypothetical protein